MASRNTRGLRAFPVCVLLIAAIVTTPSWAAEASARQGNSILGQLVVLAFLAVIATGLYLGWTRRVVVFRNYDDLALVFGCAVSALLALAMGDAWLLATVFWMVSTALAVAVILRTWQDNGVLLLPIILVTKLVFSFLWIHHLIELIVPSGSTLADRSRSRGIAVLVLLVLTPVIGRLVRDHESALMRRE
ncbi:hypothetical protein [Xanthobacter agilis]|uniref:hypothetical protein n=1 Tax=Xanthobacter agilis TaxID=47492 RepID=UPI003728FFC1